VQTAFADAADGRFGGEVRANRTAVVMLKASFDPRWSATVDGVDARTEMIAPGFVGVRVAAGVHRVRFAYRPYPWYWALFAVGAVLMIALVSLERLLIRRRPRHAISSGVASPDPRSEAESPADAPLQPGIE
jgi:uncharacterized membrane protein YfhO